jgi:predicted transposase YbfD/YdcC
MALSKSPPRVSRVSLLDHFADLQDPRREHGRRHGLWDMIALTICGAVAGADSWAEVAEYGRRKQDFLGSFLELPHGIPSHDTFNRVFALLDPTAFHSCFTQWVAALVEATAGRLIAVDGKTLRGSGDPAAGRGPLHLVSAWAAANHLTLGQVAVEGKSNEITAIPELLRLLDLHGAVVTIDAMGCQKEIARQIEAAGGDYVLALKDNHPTLHSDVLGLFLRGLEDDFAGLAHRQRTTHDDDHGRRETRHFHIVEAPADLLADHPDWVGLKTLGMVISHRHVAGAEPTVETRFFLSSLPAKVKAFAQAVRGHWGIEALHWSLDVSFREDASRLRKDHGPENLALLRRLAVSLLKQGPPAKVGIAGQRKAAGWDDEHLLEILSASLT